MTDTAKLSTNGGGNGAAPPDLDAVETTEWLEALDAVAPHEGPDRARDLLTRVIERAQHAGTGPIASLNTAYVNTIPRSLEPPFPGGDEAFKVERRLGAIVRWEPICMVLRANKISSELGGHIATYQSLATLMEVGFNHFWHGVGGADSHGGDLVDFHGHFPRGN